ncbi:hypothetical protein HDU99_008187, partial [Rhizoclosmatium hyalinum]
TVSWPQYCTVAGVPVATAPAAPAVPVQTTAAAAPAPVTTTKSDGFKALALGVATVASIFLF